MVLLWANRSWEDVFWREELGQLQLEHAGSSETSSRGGSDSSIRRCGGGDRFTLVHTLSREQREGCEHGHVDRALLQRVFGGLDREGSRFLVVGTKAMKREAHAHLAALGFSGPPLLQKRLNVLPWTWRTGPRVLNLVPKEERQ